MIIRPYIVFLFISFHSSAQIRPFEDYTKCQAGFLKANGDTLYSGQFESVEEFSITDSVKPNKQKKAWVVVFQDKRGCIDENGKWILECNYGELKYYPGYELFWIRLNSKYGLMKADGDTLFSPIYDRVQFQYLNNVTTIRTSLNGREAVYTITGLPVISEKMDLRSHIYESKEAKGKTKVFYSYKLDNGTTGLAGVSAENGNEILPPIYRKIDFLVDERNTAEDVVFFAVQDTLSRHALFDETGKQRSGFYTGKRVSILPVHNIAVVSGAPKYKFAMIYEYDRNNHKTAFILDLKTAKETIKYEEVFPCQDYFVCSTKKSLIVLDSSLQVIVELPRASSLLCSYKFTSDNLYHLENEQCNRRLYEEIKTYNVPKDFVNRTGKLLIVEEYQKPSTEERKNGFKYHLAYRVICPGNKTLYPNYYDKIHRLVSKESIFYWGINANTDGTLDVDVFSDSGYLLRSLHFGSTEALTVLEQLKVRFEFDNYKNSEPVFFVFNTSGKYRAIHHNGIVMTDYVFSVKPRFEKQISDLKSVFSVEKQKKIHFLTEAGKPLFESDRGYDRITRLEGNQGYSLDFRNAVTLVNNDFELIADSIVSLKDFKPPHNLNVPENPVYTGKVGKQYYLLTDGKWQKLDSTFFKNPRIVNQPKQTAFTVDSKGIEYVFHLDDDPVPVERVIGWLRCVLFHDTLTISRYSDRKVVNVIEHVSSIQSESERNILIRMVDGHQGMLDAETGLWRIKPEYKEIQSEPSYSEYKDFYWVRKEEESNGKWFVIDAQGKRITEAIFDEPTYLTKEKPLMHFKSNGKYGFMNQNFQVKIQPTYDAVVQHQNITVYMKDKKPYLVFTTGKAMEIKHDISDFFVDKNYLFLFNNSLEIVSNDGNVLVPAMPLQKAMTSYALVNYFMVPSKNTKQTFPTIDNFKVFTSNTDFATRYYSNHVIVDEAMAHLKKLKLIGVPPPSSYSYAVRKICKIEPVYLSKYICSERVYGDCFPESRTKSHNFKGGCGYRVYHISKDTCVQLKLEDLLKDDESSRKKLDELILAEIQKKQSLGMVCADLNWAINVFKMNFEVVKDELFFYNETLEETIVLKLINLKGILRHPEWFN